MRKKIVAANWKMNLLHQEAEALTQQVMQDCQSLALHQQVIFCSPSIHIPFVQNIVMNTIQKGFYVGAQNCHYEKSGAFTGEISIPMLQNHGIGVVIIGHSARRQYFQESNEMLRKKVDALVTENMHILFCCGEPADIREAGTQNAYVEKQLEESILHVSVDDLLSCITIAYEPIWAIGTGLTASTEQAQEMHAFIRSVLTKKYGADIANEISILYGGSCNATNADELFACPDVDGGLIGGASLKAETFIPIIKALR